ncbi:AIR synthase-related protein [Butyrivibrio sp. VCB2006]|uniref:AIR synthase-related protein n=1 Tax=Butyrivibrio sp. VCB2006 TaxID=1280679 RepID=UPI00040B9F93|nr:AIR synthase-related protein [Butyrivibrio sp. VCB2006]
MRFGKITENALKRSVLKQLRTEFKNKMSAAVGTDCAFSESKRTFSTIAPVTVDVQDAGYYGVVKAVNGLVSQGLTTDHVEVSVLLPSDAEEPVLKKIVKDAIDGAKACGVVYAGGHTEVTAAVNRPIVTVSGVGYYNDSRENEEKEVLFSSKPAAGQSLVITKWVAMEGTAMLASEKYQELTERYPAPFIDEAKGLKDSLFVGKEMEIALESGITAAHDLSGGGVFAGLWEMAGRAGCGLKVDMRTIPLRQETVEICEFFTINPYQLLSGGALLLATENGEKLVSDLQEKGIPAVVIGQLIEGNDKIVVNSDETRFLESPQADEILSALG